MRKFLLLIVLWCVVVFSYSQMDTSIVYLDSEWKEVSEINYEYFRKVFKVGKLWGVKDFYKDGVLQMSGFYLDKKLKKKHGQFDYYSKQGVRYSEYHYVKGKKNGLHIMYQKDSSVYARKLFKKDKLFGESYWYHDNGIVASREDYMKGEMTKYTFYNENGEELKGDYLYELLPEYPGGLSGLSTFISENVIYPKQAIDNNIQGRVLVKFIVEKDGTVNEVKSENYIHSLLNHEAERVVKSFSKWKPAKFHNLPARVVYTVPINFKLKNS